MSFPYSGAPTSQAPADRIYVGLDLSLTSTGVAIIHGDTTTVQRITSKGRKGATSAEQTERLVDIVERIAAVVPVSDHDFVVDRVAVLFVRDEVVMVIVRDNPPPPAL